MRAPIAVALIVCGTILIALPYMHNTLATKQVTDTMMALNKTVNLTAHLPKYADVACMVGGFVMILVGIIADLRSGGKRGQ